MNRRQSGAAVVEFALVLTVFLTVLLAIFDYGLVLYKLNSVAEATRRGARHAVVCDTSNSASILAEMQKIVPDLTSGNVKIDWYGQNDAVSTTCTHENCTGVSVSVSGVTLSSLSPASWIGFSSLTIPGFTAYLSREIMGQDPGSGSICN